MKRHPAAAFGLSAVLVAVAMLWTASGWAASAKEIDIKVNATLEEFYEKVGGGRNFVKAAEGVLVFPTVTKAGFVVGGEYGEGALRVKGKTVDYYSIAGASVGFQLGAQVKSLVIAFLEKRALEQFRNSRGWKAGVDGSIAIAEFGAGKTIDTENIRDPIVAFVFSNKGLMYNLTLEGSKFTKLDK